MCNFIIFIICFSLTFSHFKAEVCDERYCLYNLDQEASYEEAKSLCHQNNSYLLQLENDQVRELFARYSAKNIQYPKKRILLNLQVKTHRWNCIDTNKGKFEEFQGGSVDSITPNAVTFLSVDKKDAGYEIQAREEFYKKKVICEAALLEETCIKHSSDVLSPKHYYSNNMCFYLLADTYPWYDANAHCAVKNASLVSQHNIKEVFEFFKENFWINCGSEMWYWKHTKTPVMKANWFYNKPSSDPRLQCAYLTVVDEWMRSNCSDEYTILCTKDKLQTVSSSYNTKAGLTVIFATFFLFYYN